MIAWAIIVNTTVVEADKSLSGAWISDIGRIFVIWQFNPFTKEQS